MKPVGRRKGRSLDGSVPGIHYNQFTSGSSGSIPEPFSAQSLAKQVPGHFADYDPAGPVYNFTGPDYQPYDAWSGLPLKPTPAFRLPPPPTMPQPEDIDYEACLRRETMIQQILQEAAENAVTFATDPLEPSSHDLLAQLQIPDLIGAQLPSLQSDVIESLDKHVADHVVPNSCPGVDDAMSIQLPHLLAQTAEEPEDLFSIINTAHEQQMASGLEAIVEQAMVEQAPDPFDEEQRLLNMHLQQMMDPFSPMGPML